ncbi:tRNA (N(6)-L-threonylcarbamoyladenosine(37)-C(2))-methylthiotransferase MtaB [Clostridium algidicarnis]|uniref:Threonylcarbamoyladenosine tRNA methylthiotransferase MtaB n=1 Tax=Clostridium algidicarnis DSM 15099 TaxID=1121295 RepID=A0A2S6G0X7_9CLOT|nr:tRNA (N(6)-L-threonylcarbamoyladenosine(37)-C(2))-methylthiotransferase MtaB [Clostridium algidicarnis]MBU3203011.1 tRNA (N(6)-L-threonylcarbamoyladenosine(37)-C(2))-methylthiotransferase MtaB [Clostridium algidicarnis]MBU3211165.1 tRNA (N(6)-L-threonylcarbamoyladenosine(37)-C(2))-methylthiotransferase MtaB [Clostridium algidicarnis]MBU3222327.1 tRNA (N(6)-L-threonylcarbamoyladenosine(37)-C(2))-methylthiotransferase MtaB [Clostridium algidicarnis]MCB2286495.1 tRNA (N(6)-L-threonylcarbamoylad
MKVAFSTLGCRVNQYESEAMAEKFIREGYEIVDFDGFSDVYVINTCTVTNMGDKKSRQIIGRARRENPEAIIAVVGCYAQISSTEVSLIEGVNVVLGTRNKGDIVYFVNRARDENKQIIKVGQVLKNHDFEDLNIEEYQDRTRAFIKIQDGCNRFCSYCLIPYARGGVCSKDPDKVIQEIKNLAKHGFKEVILSGIHTASYGVDLDGNVTLVDILSLIEEIPGIERVRIGSIDPTFFTDEVLRKIKGLKKLCHHFHLSLQSGCDETLERMNRKYTSKEYKNIVEKLRETYDDVSITTDVIVGFPGESQEEFEKTYEFLKEIKLSKTHVFKFSPRKGTKAETMKDQVDGNIKDERSHRLIELNLINEKEFINKFIGKTFKVLYEQEVLKENGVYEGYSENYIKIKSKYSDENIIGKVAETIIKKVENDYAKGVIKD